VWTAFKSVRQSVPSRWTGVSESTVSVGCHLNPWNLQLTMACRSQMFAVVNAGDWLAEVRPVESHSGPGKNILAPPPLPPKNILVGPVWGENFKDFLNGAFWCTLYFWTTVGPPNPHGVQGNLPLTPPLDGPGRDRSDVQEPCCVDTCTPECTAGN